MNIFTASAILQLLLIVGGNGVAGERKRVGCYYLGATSEKHGTVYPEDIDASICTHLLYLHGAINNETLEIKLESPMRNTKTGGEGFVPRLAKLKGVNPDLKVILLVVYQDMSWHSQEPPKRSEIIQSGIKWLNESGFDGLEIVPSSFVLQDVERIADFLCEMKNEFNKHGYSLSVTFNGVINQLVEGTLTKISRCSDSISMMTDNHVTGVHRIAPMSVFESAVDWYVERGVPSSKISIIVPSFGAIFILNDPEVTELGAEAYALGNEDEEIMRGQGIRNKELLRKMNDTSLGWTIRRDNETLEPYAFTTTGLWTSYEDTTSMEYKARYVMEKGLGGITTVCLDYEDDEGIGGEGRFPLTRTLYNKLKQAN